MNTKINNNDNSQSSKEQWLCHVKTYKPGEKILKYTIKFENRFSFYCLSPRPRFIPLPFSLTTILKDRLVTGVHFVNEVVKTLKFLRKFK